MGRKRGASPVNLPEQIDYQKVPRGIYWDATGNGRWYTLEPHPDGHGMRRKTVAQRNARMSDLHAIAEQRQGKAARGSIRSVVVLYKQSLAFQELGDRTRNDYAAYADAIMDYPLKNGTTLGDAIVDRLSPGFIRRLIDVIAMGRPGTPGKEAVPGYPTKANHWLRFLRRLFGWAREHDHVQTNPAAGVKQVRERRNHRMPTLDAFGRVQMYARACSMLGVREKGRMPPYLWAAMEIGYRARLRGIETLTLTDANLIDGYLQTNRRKGSRDNRVTLSPELAAALAAVREYRAEVWERRSYPTKIRPEQRFLFVGEDGEPLTRSGFNTAWGRMIRNAVADQVLTEEERFGLHGLKHRGVTDSTGDKKQASGHKTDAMRHLYDHEVPIVDAAGAASQKAP